MNVAHCIHGLGLGGAQQIIKLIVRGRTGEQFRHMVYSCEDGMFRDEIEKAGATVRIISRRLPKLDPLWAIALARAMRADGIDVVHTHLFGDSLHGYLAARAASNLPVVMTLHIGAEGQTRLQRLGYRWLLQRCTRNIACTESVRESWRAHSAAAIETIPNAIETPAASLVDMHRIAGIRQGLGIDPTTTVIGAVGRLVEQKGLDNLIRAFADLARSGTTAVALVIVGDGPLRAELEGLARSERVAERVKFAGLRSDIPQLLHAVDIVAFGSKFEGLPMALLESMAAARCIVATDAPGILDAVTPGQEALIAPRGDVSRLSAALREAVADPALRQRLGDAARRRFLRDFTAERMVERYEAVYREVCGRRSAVPEVASRAACS